MMKMFVPNFVAPKIQTTPQSQLIAQAVAAARQSDVVVACVGELNNMAGEGASRADIGMTDAQSDLLKALKATGKPLVVVLTTGRPLVLNWEAENADAILCTWGLGSEAGHAIADVLFGDVNPSARLTTSFPRSVGQLPLYYNHKNTGRPHPDDAPYQKFRSCYEDVVNSPLYCFGYGLSYTKFEYGDISLSQTQLSANSTVTASINVKNTGSRAGKESEGIASCFLEKGFESDPFKLWVVDFFPESQILDVILQTHPILHHILRFFSILLTCDVCYNICLLLYSFCNCAIGCFY